jgi:hypothetical protein
VTEPRARQYRVNLTLQGLTWKLTGFETVPADYHA